jgi:hypothetical protein
VRSRSALIGMAVLLARPALAAGGAHVVDDSAIETAGTCHVETWVTGASHGGGLAYVGPGCTLKQLPVLEFGGFVVHNWGGGIRDTLIGLTPKWTIQSEYRGLGIALDGNLAWSTDHGRLDNASLIVPFTIDAQTWLRLDFNAGWLWTRAGDREAGFVGAQAEMQVAHDLNLMIEAFTRTIEKPGGQIGLRWTPHRGRIDLDLIAGRRADGVAPTSVTLGLTIRT